MVQDAVPGGQLVGAGAVCALAELLIAKAMAKAIEDIVFIVIVSLWKEYYWESPSVANTQVRHWIQKPASIFRPVCSHL